MRKFLSISLLCLYLLASAGISITAHYCGGNLASLALFEKTSCCCEDEEEGKDDCCKNEVKTIKISDDQLKIETSKKVFVPYYFNGLNSNPHFSFGYINTFPKCLTGIQMPRAPECENTIPIYKKNHSLLFYC